MRVSQQLTDVILDIMRVFATQYIVVSMTPQTTQVIVENAPHADEVTIPFFSKPPRDYVKRGQ